MASLARGCDRSVTGNAAHAVLPKGPCNGECTKTIPSHNTYRIIHCVRMCVRHRAEGMYEPTVTCWRTRYRRPHHQGWISNILSVLRVVSKTGLLTSILSYHLVKCVQASPETIDMGCDSGICGWDSMRKFDSQGWFDAGSVKLGWPLFRKRILWLLIR